MKKHTQQQIFYLPFVKGSVSNVVSLDAALIESYIILMAGK